MWRIRLVHKDALGHERIWLLTLPKELLRCQLFYQGNCVVDDLRITLQFENSVRVSQDLSVLFDQHIASFSLNVCRYLVGVNRYFHYVSCVATDDFISLGGALK
jgi:hypothetical protein